MLNIIQSGGYHSDQAHLLKKHRPSRDIIDDQSITVIRNFLFVALHL